MKRLLIALVAVLMLYTIACFVRYYTLPPEVQAQTNTFCAANLACTVTAAWTFTSINTVQYIGGAAPQIGGSADIGAQINAAYAAAPSTGQKAILVPQTGGGCYNFTTPIVLNTSGKYFPIEGLATGNQTGGINQGVCLNYTPTTATTAVTLDYTPPTGGGLVGNPALKNIIISNNSCITPGGCGSSATGLILGSSNGMHFATLDNVKVSGFSTNISIGVSNGWGIKFEQVSSAYGSTGLSLTSILENIRWHGGTISLNGTGVTCPNSSGLTFESVSFDGNLTLGVSNTGCNITFIAPWFENPTAPNTNTQYITQSTGQFTITGGQILDDNTSGTIAQQITVSGGDFDIRGVNVFSGGQTVTNLINNSGGGIGSIDWFAVSPTLDAPTANATCATAYNCIVKRITGVQSPFVTAVLSLPVAGAGDPSCSGLAGISNLVWDKASTNRITMCNNAGPADNVVGAVSTDTLSNKSFAAGSVVPSAAGGTDLGSTALPFGNLWLGTAATNNFKFTPAATAAARTVSLPDPGTNVNLAFNLLATSAAFATATTAGTCVQNTTSVPGAATTMVAAASPVSTPGVGAVWSAFVSSAGNVTINECAVATSAGGTIAFNIRVAP